jgi:hypothetical protein
MKNIVRHASSHHSFMYLWILGALLVLLGLGISYLQSHPEGVIDGQHEGDVRATVLAFGNHLNDVSLLAPSAAEDIRKAYAPYVSAELLAAWEADPASAPGRITSSPWPDHIEVDGVVQNEQGGYDVAGRVMLLSSAGDAGSIPVALTVENRTGGYVITRYEERPGEAPIETPHAEAATVTAALNQTVSAHGVSLTPLAVVEDSRCPMDAMCVWQGQARVEVRIVDGMGTSTMQFTLASADPITSEIASLWLTDVQPYPMASDPTEDAQYRFTFRIEPR